MKTVPMQKDGGYRTKSWRLAEDVARAAYAEYAIHHGSQSFETLFLERGGLSMAEVVMLLYDALLRERGQLTRENRSYALRTIITEVKE